VRFNADMSAKTNYLFARVEQTVNLQVRNAVVKFYMKHPGSGGGAANLNLLGQVAVPAALAVGAPQNVSLAWTVPPGTPGHSCLFAVVRSDAEQDGNQSVLDWWQFENLSRLDNDWAQRNLAIDDYESGNTGDSNRLESGVFFIELPPAKFQGGAKLVLDVDAVAAAGADAVEIEVLGDGVYEITPGSTGWISVPIRRRQRLVAVVVSVAAPGGMAIGSMLAVGVTPSVGKREMIGFSAAFRSAGPADVIRQTLDVALGAFLDLGTFYGHAGADDLICGVRGLVACGPYTTQKVLETVLKLREALLSAKRELSRLPQARTTGVADALEHFLKAAHAYEAGQGSKADALSAFRSLVNRLEGAASLALRVRENAAGS
jgi:hypothetical protein